MNNAARKLMAVGGSLALAFLAGCGGGGDSTAETPATPVAPVVQATAAKYVGTWGGCFARTATTSRRETIVFTQLAADSVSFTFTEVSFAQLSCAGAGTTEVQSGTIAFAGTKTIGSDTVDKGTVTSAGSPVQKQVFLVRTGTPSTVTFGKAVDDGGVLDAEGYPTTLESGGLPKQ